MSSSSLTPEEKIERIEELESRVTQLEGLTSALQAQNKMLKRVLAGSEDEFSTWNVDNMVPFHDRLEDVESTVGQHAEKFQMFVVEDGESATPDDRAMHLRQVLLNRARKKDDGIAKMPRDSAGSALGGGLHNGTIIDAMRRAAAGYEADISGNSDLEPVDGITFVLGGKVGSDGDPNQSFLQLDLADVTGEEAHQNLMMGDSGPGGRE